MGSSKRMAAGCGAWVLGWACGPLAVQAQEAPGTTHSPASEAAVAPLPALAAPAPPVAQGPGLLGRWRQQLDRYTPHLAADASTFSLGDGPLDASPVPAPGEGALRLSPKPLAKPGGAWSLKPASDFADLRQMLRSRTLQWQPVSAGRWQVGAAIGPVQALSSRFQPESGGYALMPVASYQADARTEWRLGLLPASGTNAATFVVKLRLKAF